MGSLSPPSLGVATVSRWAGRPAVSATHGGRLRCFCCWPLLLLLATPSAASTSLKKPKGVCRGEAVFSVGAGKPLGHCVCTTCAHPSPDCAAAQCVGSNCTRAVCRRGRKCKTLHGYSPVHCADCVCLTHACLRRPEVSPLFGSICSNISDQATCLEVAAACIWGTAESGAVHPRGRVELAADIPSVESERGDSALLLSKVLIKPPLLPPGHRPHVSISCSQNSG